jgi:hypothetical protein
MVGETKEREADSAYNARCEAKERISQLELVLHAAKQDSRPVCGVLNPHKCVINRSTSRGNKSNIRHRFHRSQPKGKAQGPFGYKISNRRIIAFRDIQKTTNSKFGNGHSCLRTAQDVDGNATRRIAGDLEGNDDTPTDSWSLLRERFCHRAEIDANRKEERNAQTIAYAKWYRLMHSVHCELRTMVHPSSTQETVRSYDRKVLIRNWKAALSFRIKQGKL